MIRRVLPLAVLLAVASCGGATIVNNGDTDTEEDVVVDLPGGVGSNGDVERYEEQDDAGNGYAQSITYDSASDTFSVDNLAFDGANTYTRSTAMANIGGSNPATGPFAVYEGPASQPDSVTGLPIGQFLHRAIYAQSSTGRTEFALVRTGSYVNYGFGGFVYRRNGQVVLPSSGQARYSGDYAGLVDFEGSGGILYSSGDMEMAIDFRDFNEGAGVRGEVTNRAFYDMNGNDVTAAYLAALNSDLALAGASGYTELPALVFHVGPGVMDANGEISGNLSSTVTDGAGEVLTHESGTFYGVLAGDGTAGTDEVVGVIVVTSDAPGTNGSVTQRETGGFILYR